MLMKRILFSLLCLFVNLYMPLSANTWKDIWCDTWNVLEYNVSGLGIPEETWRYYLSNDTIINGLTYTIVNRYWTADETESEYVTAVRFTEDKKVYVFHDNTECLFYDFSVQVGDTVETLVNVYYESYYQKSIVHNVKMDSITHRNMIVLYCMDEQGRLWDDDYYALTWIEGIGSKDVGFLIGRPIGNTGGIGYKLLCAYRGDELKYTGYLYDEYGCEYNTVTAVEDIHTSESKVQKVIQDGQLFILHEDKTYNVMGMEVE